MDKKTKLAFFDFDGTLIATPLPDVGKGIYKNVTGNDWPHVGWWGQPLSLDTDIFDIKPIPSVVSDYKKEKSDTNTIVVMLTGRMVKLSGEVKKILDQHNLHFDEYHYNRGGSTEVSKIKTMETLLEKYKDVVEIQMWDDRLEHIPIFEDWGKKMCLGGRLKDFSVTVVLSENHK
jgi:hypothetical protein